MINIGYAILGVILLFIPGVLLSFLLYPGEERFDFWKRIGISIGLSVFIDMLIITILAQPAISALRFTPTVGSILIFSAACGVLLFLREESLQTFLAFFGISSSEN